MYRFILSFILGVMFVFAISCPVFAENPPCREQGEQKDAPEITPFEVKIPEMNRLEIYVQENEEGPMYMHKMGMAPCFIMFPGMDSDRGFLNTMIIHHQAAIDMCDYILRNGKDPTVKSWAEGMMAAQQNEIATMQQWLDEMRSKPREKYGMHMGEGWGMPQLRWEMPMGLMEMTDEPQEMRPLIKMRFQEMDGSFISEGKEMMERPMMEHPMMEHPMMDGSRMMYGGDMKMLGEMSGMLRHLKQAGNPDKAFVKLMIKHHSSAVEMALKALQKGEDPRITELALNIIKSQSDEIYKFRGWLDGAESQPRKMHKGH